MFIQRQRTKMIRTAVIGTWNAKWQNGMVNPKWPMKTETVTECRRNSKGPFLDIISPFLLLITSKSPPNASYNQGPFEIVDMEAHQREDIDFMLFIVLSWQVFFNITLSSKSWRMPRRNSYNIFNLSNGFLTSFGAIISSYIFWLCHVLLFLSENNSPA